MDFTTEIYNKIMTDSKVFADGFSMKNHSDTFPKIKKGAEDRLNEIKENSISKKLLEEYVYLDILGEFIKVNSFRILSSDLEKETKSYIRNHHIVRFLGEKEVFKIMLNINTDELLNSIMNDEHSNKV